MSTYRRQPGTHGDPTCRDRRRFTCARCRRRVCWCFGCDRDDPALRAMCDACAVRTMDLRAAEPYPAAEVDDGG